MAAGRAGPDSHLRASHKSPRTRFPGGLDDAAWAGNHGGGIDPCARSPLFPWGDTRAFPAPMRDRSRHRSTARIPLRPVHHNEVMPTEKELLERIRILEEQNSVLQDKLDMIYAILAPDFEEVDEGDDEDRDHLVQIDRLGQGKKPD